MDGSRFSPISSEMQPPVFEPISPKKLSDRWFPKGRSLGLYESGGRVAPNVTSILGWEFPFDQSRWKKSEPDIDHDGVTSVLKVNKDDLAGVIDIV